MKKVFISGCYDILHGGHIEFFNQAKSLGDYLIVSFASDEVLWMYKKRKPSIPENHKLFILSSLTMIDEVMIGSNVDQIGIEFEDALAESRPDILAVTEDDTFGEIKKQLCKKYGVEYVVLPKTLNYDKISTTNILNNIRTPVTSPLRVDFGGGWLDVPSFASSDSYIVNCAVTPLVSLKDWQYKQNSGMGGSAAWAYLNGKDGIQSELDMGVGWQDPAIVQETGVCVWRSGERPVLECKYNPDWLTGKMALLYTGTQHVTKDLKHIPHDWDSIKLAGNIAKTAIEHKDVQILGNAINTSYKAQLAEDMEELTDYGLEISKKYCGSGHGGYALYIFESEHNRDEFGCLPNTILIEPYLRETGKLW